MMAAEVYVVQSKVRALAKKKGFRFSGEAVDALSKLVESTVAAAGARAKANKRQTIKASDI
jgi:histone H3/H4